MPNQKSHPPKRIDNPPSTAKPNNLHKPDPAKKVKNDVIFAKDKSPDDLEIYD